MTKEELQKACALERVTVFLEPAYIFDKGIIGITPDCFHVIYDYEKLVEAFITEEGCSESEAREWLDYNTIPCLPMLGEGQPIMMFPIFDEVEKVA